jgi:hypothetical protein
MSGEGDRRGDGAMVQPGEMNRRRLEEPMAGLGGGPETD